TDVDPNLPFDVILGTAIAHLLANGRRMSDEDAARLAEVVIEGLRAGYRKARSCERASSRRVGGAWPRLGVLELLEIALDLPVGDLRAVLVPLGALGIDEVAEDVVAEGFADDLVLLELVEGLAERAREL